MSTFAMIAAVVAGTLCSQALVWWLLPPWYVGAALGAMCTTLFWAAWRPH